MASSARTESLNRLRVRWAAIGAAVAVTLGAGTIVTVDAVQTSGERLTYVATEPCRLIDTRPEPQFNVGPRNTPLGPTDTFTINAQGAQGQCTAAQLPTDAAALALNVTVPTATANGFLTIWGDGDRPNASSLNPAPNQPPTPNAVTVTRSDVGTFNVYNQNGFTHLIIDIVGHHLDHNHDDRYDTKSQAEARIEANIADPDTGREIIDVSTFDMQVGSVPGFVYSNFGAAWASSGPTTACLLAPVDVVPGQQVESVSFTVRKGNSSLVDGQVSFGGIDTRPNGSTSGVQPTRSALFESFIAIGGTGTRIEPTADNEATDGRTIEEGFAYFGQLCTNDPVTVFGARVVLSNP